MTESEMISMMNDCTLCPRQCHADRLNGQVGFCGETASIRGARAALHFWEEPCISGEAGSGAVFFSGCNMRCVFCQNHEIAGSKFGKQVSVEQLADAFLRLQKQGANNINLVTATHFIPQVIMALDIARENGLSIPIVYNTSGYEEVSSLRLLDGYVDIYLPDFKYYSAEPAGRLSKAPDYFEKAKAAIAEMVRQCPTPVFDEATGLMKKGIIVRHLVLPGYVKESKKVLRYLHETYKDAIYISIMNQYTPLPHVAAYPDLNRKVSAEEYDRVLHFAEMIGIEQGFMQEGEAALESFIPSFDGEGL